VGSIIGALVGLGLVTGLVVRLVKQKCIKSAQVGQSSDI
jgi:hypothetical protein